MVINKRRFQDFANPILAAYFPWHSKLGQDGYPRKFVWDGDKAITEVKDLIVIYDDVTGVPKKITANDQDAKEISFEITRDSNTKVTATFKHDGTTQAKIEGELLDGTYGTKLRCNATYTSDSDLDFQIDAEYKQVNPNPDASAWVTIAFNQNNYDGWVTPGQEDFPQFLKDFDSDLETFAKQGKVAVINQTFCESMALPCFQYYSGIEPGAIPVDQQLCIAVTVFVDYFTMIGSFIWVIINIILIYLGVPM